MNENDIYWEVYYGPIRGDFPYVKVFDTEQEAINYIHDQTGERLIAEDYIYTNYKENREYYFVRTNNKD